MEKQDILIGKTMDEAVEILHNCTYRIVEKAGMHYVITQDLKPDRFNLHLTDKNIIYKVEFY